MEVEGEREGEEGGRCVARKERGGGSEILSEGERERWQE